MEGKITKIIEKKITAGKKDQTMTETGVITIEKIEETTMKIGRTTNVTGPIREILTITGGTKLAGKDLLSGMTTRERVFLKY